MKTKRKEKNKKHNEKGETLIPDYTPLTPITPIRCHVLSYILLLKSLFIQISPK